MSGETATWDLSLVSLIVANVPIESAFGEKELVSIEREVGRWGHKVTADGVVVRYKTQNKLHLVHVKLMQNSPANDLLSTLANLDENTPNGAGIGAFLLKDNGGRSLLEGSKCWIERDPDIVIGQEPTERDWLLVVADMNRFDGGNG